MKNLITLTFILLSSGVFAQQYCCHEEGVAFDGYDITSYFTDEGIKHGSPEFTTSYNGMTLQFANKENRDAFTANPDKYFPEYGAWCAIAMSLGSLVKPNYNFYKIENGELLFFTIQGFVNGITLWNKDSVGNRRKADQYYESVY